MASRFRLHNSRSRLFAAGRRVKGRAFSLIEVLAAVTIFSIAIVALIEGIASSTRTQGWVESQSLAIMLAQNIIEEIEYVGELREGTENGSFEEFDSRFRWMTEILETDLEGLYEVRVAVLWSEGGAERDYTLVTYMREREVDEFAEPQI